MNTLIGGMFTENGKEIGKVLKQVKERGIKTFMLGQLTPSAGKDSIRITIDNVYLTGGSVNGNKRKCEIVRDDERIAVTVENAIPNVRSKTTDIILSIP